MLGQAKGDVLLILDCCYSAQAARDRNQQRIIPPNVELLAASPTGTETNGVGDHSFTSKFIEESRVALNADGYATVSILHKLLSQADRTPSQSPVHIALEGRRGSVKLEQLEGQLAERASTVSSSQPLQLRMHVPNDMTSEVLDEIGEWLSNRPPRAILQAAFVELATESKHIRDYLRGAHNGPSVTDYRNLSEPSRRDIQALWTFLGTRLKYAKNFMSDITPATMTALLSDPDTGDKMNPMTRDVRALQSTINSLQRSIDRGIQDLPTLDDQSLLSQAVQEITGYRLQARETLRIRELAVSESQIDRSSPPLPSNQVTGDVLKKLQSLSLGRDSSNNNVLIEYKYYSQRDRDERVTNRNKQRMNQLVSILQAPDSQEYRTLQCTGWSPEPSFARHALQFKLPPGYQGDPISLHEAILMELKRPERPTLGQKFTIAKLIGQALRRWHMAGWVHQGIASYNIVFFRTMDDKNIDFSNPYLCGFEYTRADGKLSSQRDPSRTEPEYELYQHPDRQPSGFATHRKEHDLYSFGLLLLEIGLWDTLAQAFFRGKKLEPLMLREKIIRRQDGILRSTMGRAYEDAVITCMKGNASLRSNETRRSNFDRAFQALVLDKIVGGDEIDCPTIDF